MADFLVWLALVVLGLLAGYGLTSMVRDIRNL